MADIEAFIADFLPDADEFQRIAIAECFRDTEGLSPDPKNDEAFRRLGIMVLEAYTGEHLG